MKTIFTIILLSSATITGCQSGTLGTISCYSGPQKILLARGYIVENENATYSIEIEGRKRSINADCLVMYGDIFKWERTQHHIPEESK